MWIILDSIQKIEENKS